MNSRSNCIGWSVSDMVDQASAFDIPLIDLSWAAGIAF